MSVLHSAQGRIVVHYSLESERSLGKRKLRKAKIPSKYWSVFQNVGCPAWAVRHVVNHRIDPLWERGKYCRCHEDFRNNVASLLKIKRLQSIWLFDSVYARNNGRIGGHFVIRSAMRIRKPRMCYARDGSWDLVFADYWFTRDKPIRVKTPNTTRYGTKVEGRRLSRLLHEIQSSYEHCQENAKPSLIPQRTWSAMKAIVTNSSRCNHHRKSSR